MLYSIRPAQNRNTKYLTRALLGFYYLHVLFAVKSSFPMRSKGPSVTKRPLTSAASGVKAGYRAILVCVCGSEDRGSPHAYTLTCAHLRAYKARYPYWTMLHRLQLAFTTYVLCVSDPTLYVYVIRIYGGYALVTSSGRVGCAVETST